MEFLFERLCPAGAKTADPLDRLRSAVFMQLRWLIGSRDWRSEEEGTGLVDVCMPDLPSLNGDSAALTRYARRMLRLIELHEPRLRQPRIELRRTGRAITPFAVVVHGLLGVVAEGESVRFEYEPGPRHSL